MPLRARPALDDGIRPGCNKTGAECAATVSSTPAEALVIAGLVVGLYLLLIALTGRVPLLKLGTAELSVDSPKAETASEADLIKGVQVAPEGARAGEFRATLARADDSARHSYALYSMLPTDVRVASDILWKDEWGIAAPLAFSLRSVRIDSSNSAAPWLLETVVTDDDVRVMRVGSSRTERRQAP